MADKPGLFENHDRILSTVERALEPLITALFKARDQRRQRPDDDTDDEFISDQRDLEFLIERPLEGAYLIAIRRLGLHLSENGGAMGLALDHVCDRRQDWQRCVSLMSGRWKGIIGGTP